MSPEILIKERIQQRGLKLSYISEKTHIDSDKLSRSLSGKRNFKPEEFIAMCIFLNIKVEEFNQIS